MVIIWLKTATRTRFEQLDFIARKNPAAAVRLDEEIERQIDRLADLPEIGRVGRVNETRELVLVRTQFVAVYRVKYGRIEILRILHSAQNWPNID